MESNILQQLAAFDVKAKIDISICFEDSNEAQEVAVITENVINDVKSNSQDTNASLHNFLEHIKKEIKQELPEATEENLNENELNSDEQNISKEILTLQTESLQNRTTNINDERNRKQELLQIYANKKDKKESTEENITDHLANHNKENNTHKSLVSNSNFAHQDVATRHLNPANVESNAESPSSSESEKIKLKSFILGCLSALSENMRLVMEAYAHHKKYNTAYECYEKQKMQYFNESYAIVLKLIIPEIHNREFMSTFLHQTYQYALKIPGLNKCVIRDYAILLRQLIDWANKKQKDQTASNQENTVQHELTGSNCFQGPVSENTPNKPEDHCSNNKQNKTQSGEKGDLRCIFSKGSPGNEISIHIDLNLNQHVSSTENLKNNGTSVAHTPQFNVDLTRPQIISQKQPTPDNKNKFLQELLQRAPQIEPMTPCVPNKQSQLYPETHMRTTNPPAKRKQLNNDIFTDPIITRQPQVQNPLQTQNLNMIGQSRHLYPQSMPTTVMLTQNELPANTAHTVYSQSTRARQSRYLLPQSMPYQNQQPVNTPLAARRQSRHSPSSYNQPIRPPSPYHQLFPQTPPNVPQWCQAWHQQIQSPLSNYQPTKQNYGVSMDIQQSGQPQLQHQHHTNTLLHYEQMVIPPQNGPVPTTQSQAIVPQYIQQSVSPHTGQLPLVLSECERRLQNAEWHQRLNELYRHQGHQQQIYKNAPRSASTDSGFNSPLNFNTSSDQTVPPPQEPHHTETTQILITHVTSLNPNVSHMAEGNCVMCKKITKKVCMGCMKIYYCTYECQLQDWLKHEPDCHKHQAKV